MGSGRKFLFSVVERKFFRWLCNPFMWKRRILVVFLERRRAENLPALHVEVILRASEREFAAGFLDRVLSPSRAPQRVRGTHNSSVKTLFLSLVSPLLSPSPH